MVSGEDEANMKLELSVDQPTTLSVDTEVRKRSAPASSSRSNGDGERSRSYTSGRKAKRGRRTSAVLTGSPAARADVVCGETEGSEKLECR